MTDDPLERDRMTGENLLRAGKCGCQTGAHEPKRGAIEDHTEEYKAEVLPLLHKAHEICCRLGIPIETIAEVSHRHLGVLGTAMREEMCHEMQCIYTLLTDNPIRIVRDIGPIVEDAMSQVAAKAKMMVAANDENGDFKN